MPEVFVPQTARALGSLATGLAAQKRAVSEKKFLERQQQFKEDQAQVANDALVKERKNKALLSELARGEKRTADTKFAERFPGAFDKQVARNNAITSELYPGSANLSGPRIRENLPNWQKDNALEQSYIKEFGQGSKEHVDLLNEILPSYIDRPELSEILKGKLGDIKADETLDKTISKTKEIKTFETGEDIRQEKARLETVADITKKAKQVEQDRTNALIDSLPNMSAENKKKLKVAILPGTGQPAEAALFPKDLKANIRTVDTFDEDGYKVGTEDRLYFTDKKTNTLVYRKIKEVEPPAEKAPPEAPTGDAATAQLGKIPTLEEFLAKAIAVNPNDKVKALTVFYNNKYGDKTKDKTKEKVKKKTKPNRLEGESIGREARESLQSLSPSNIGSDIIEGLKGFGEVFK